MKREETPTIFLVAGHPGSGKGRFAESFRNSFLQGKDEMSLEEGILSMSSFYVETSLTEEGEVNLLKEAKEKGFKINAYFLVSGRQLALLRCRYRQVIDGTPYDEAKIKKDHESSYKNIASLFPSLDLLFLVRNSQRFEFAAVYDPSEIDASSFASELKELRRSCDRLE